MSSTHSVQTAPPVPELAAALIGALAQIRQVSAAELEAEMVEGDLALDSAEAVAAIAAVETRLGRRLAQVEDLEPEQLTSVASLADLLHRRWADGSPLPTSRGG